MRLQTILIALAVTCGVSATPLHQPTKRAATAISIPTLLPRPASLIRRDDDPAKKYNVWGSLKFKNEDINGIMSTHKEDDLWCTGVSVGNQNHNKNNNLTDYKVAFDAICFFYGQDRCDPSNGEAEAIVGWDGKDWLEHTHPWKVNYWACHWQNQTIGKDVKIGDPKNPRYPTK